MANDFGIKSKRTTLEWGVSADVVWQRHAVSPEDRAAAKSQHPCLLWFTGLSGAGKSTVANALDMALHRRGYHTFLLDGDNIRLGLSRDLGFSDQDRVENIRRIGEVSKLFTDAGIIVLSAFISPFASDRQMVRSMFPVGKFIEVFMSTPISICENRDPKGLYQRARSGVLRNFTGVDSPYEVPTEPELVLDTSVSSVDECVARLLDLLQERGLIAGVAAPA